MVSLPGPETIGSNHPSAAIMPNAEQLSLPLFPPVPGEQDDEKRPERSFNPDEIDGMIYKKEFLTEHDCDELVRKINDQPWSNALSRRVQHYGWQYDYASKTVTEDTHLGPLPGWLQSIAKRLHQGGYCEEVPDQVIINEYRPGQGIASHIDRETFGPTVATISLCDCWPMDFTPVGRQTGHNVKRELFLSVGSLLVLKGDARSKWSHGIAKRKSDGREQQKKERQLRISVTFRTVKKGAAKMIAPPG